MPQRASLSSTVLVAGMKEAAAVQMEDRPKMDKDEKKKMKALEKAEKEARKLMRREAEARAALYLLHWTSHGSAQVKLPEGSASKVQTESYLMHLQDDLKKMEKVSKVSAGINRSTEPCLKWSAKLSACTFSPYLSELISGFNLACDQGS